MMRLSTPAEISRREAIAIIAIGRAAEAVGVEFDVAKAIASGASPADLAAMVIADIAADAMGDEIAPDVAAVVERVRLG